MLQTRVPQGERIGEMPYYLLMQSLVLRYKQIYRMTAQLGLPAGQSEVLGFLLHHESRE